MNQHYANTPLLSLDTVAAVSPPLAHYSSTAVRELWTRPGLSLRDRSVITLSVLIARNQMVALRDQMNAALDNGVTPTEVAEIITHLAFYAGWGNALAAVSVTKPVFEARGISREQLPSVEVDSLPIDDAAEAKRASSVADNFGTTAPGVAQFTTDVVFRNLWLRPGLAPRDRSLVTVCALVANGQTGQITYHLNRAMDNGLTQSEASEALTQLAFYAGWPNVFSALPVVKDVFKKRNER